MPGSSFHGFPRILEEWYSPESISMTVSIAQAQADLANLIGRMAPGEEVMITDGDRLVARLVAAAPSGERKLGTLRGTVLYMAPDFDAPLEDFKEYME
jgi:antitoxin (DNA-binding transcriptional repressor) of toxin-antitoxin stability system